MADVLTITNKKTIISFGHFDHEIEIEISMKDSDGNTLGILWVNEEFIKEIVRHLSRQLEILSKNNI